ncbi:unnamed protein product [Ilex paraguariensis]|uniref:G domain-containing protein n=1 Tax=Ilex paraguariensis TaxID=185542 RepID=A0ABC8U8K4_9AQUA
MSHSWVRALSARKSRHGFALLCRTTSLPNRVDNSISKSHEDSENLLLNASQSTRNVRTKHGSVFDSLAINGIGKRHLNSNCFKLVLPSHTFILQNIDGFCTLSPTQETEDELVNVSGPCVDESDQMEEIDVGFGDIIGTEVPKVKNVTEKLVEFSKVDVNKLPTVVLIGRPNVGKSALFNRLIRRREALVYNTPNDHVTRDIREGIAKLSELRFRVLDSAGLEAEASSGSVLGRTAEMTGNVLARCQVALFLIDARDGLQPMDLDVGKWLRKRAPGMKIILVMNKAESLVDGAGSLDAAAGEAYMLGFGDPIALSAETGLGMTELYEALRPLLEDYMLHIGTGKKAYSPKIFPNHSEKLILFLSLRILWILFIAIA